MLALTLLALWGLVRLLSRGRGLAIARHWATAGGAIVLGVTSLLLGALPIAGLVLATTGFLLLLLRRRIPPAADERG